jgi:hypothetical protein
VRWFYVALMVLLTLPYLLVCAVEGAAGQVTRAMEDLHGWLAHRAWKARRP